MAPTLQGLPIEILNEICSYFCSHCVATRRQEKSNRPSLRRSDTPTLGALCSTSRVFRDVATPYLYHYIFLDGELKDGRIPGQIRHLLQRKEVPIVPLLRTLVERPELADRVKWMEVTGEQDLYTVNWTETGKIGCEAASRSNLRLAPDWYRDESVFNDAEFDVQELFIELILLQMRKLEQAKFLMGPKWRFSHMTDTVADKTRPPPSLPALTSLSVLPAEDREWFSFKSLQRLMRLAPNLHTLEASRCFYDPILPCTSITGIKNLYLDGCSIRKDGVERLIAAHARLEVFEVNISAVMPRDVPDAPNFEGGLIYSDNLVPPLRQHHAKAVRRMSLFCSWQSVIPGSYLDAISILEFTNLETLCLRDYSEMLALSTLEGFSTDLHTERGVKFLGMLPQVNLRRLLFDDSRVFGLVEILTALAAAIEFQGRFAKLEMVYVKPYSDLGDNNWRGLVLDGKFHDDRISTLQSRFARIGVELLGADIESQKMFTG